MTLKRGVKFWFCDRRYKVAYVNASRAHCVPLEKKSVTLRDRKTGRAHTFRQPAGRPIDISPNAIVETDPAHVQA